ncbi:hypothetical protein D3C78_1620730 [compost metagenome]
MRIKTVLLDGVIPHGTGQSFDVVCLNRARRDRHVAKDPVRQGDSDFAYAAVGAVFQMAFI